MSHKAAQLTVSVPVGPTESHALQGPPERQEADQSIAEQGHFKTLDSRVTLHLPPGLGTLVLNYRLVLFTPPSQFAKLK